MQMKKLIILLVQGLSVISIHAQIGTSNSSTNSNSSGVNNDFSYKDRVELLQLSDAEKKVISTTNLLDLCLQYPYNINIIAYNDIQEGFKNLLYEYNGYAELFSRNDLFDVILERIKRFSTSNEDAKRKGKIERGEFSFQYLILQNIIMHEVLTNVLTKDRKIVLTQYLSLNLAILKNNPQMYGNIHTKLTSNIRDLLSSNIQERSIGDFEYWFEIPIYTPNYSLLYGGRLVDEDLSDDEVAYYNYKYSNDYPYNTITGDATATYNCHGYAWSMYDNSTSDSIVLYDVPNIYLNDNSYVLTSIESEADIITYGGGQHSARRLPSGLYESKWGIGPKMIHSRNNVPYSTNPNYMQFYKRATPIIIGADCPCGNTTYYVTNTAPNDSIDVSWSFTSEPTNISATLVQNSPSKNKCTFNTTGLGEYTVQLIATISRNNHIIGTATKTLTNKYQILFSQIGTSYGGTTYQSILETFIPNNSTVIVNPVCVVKFESPAFSNMYISHSGATLNTWNHLGNILTLVFPYSNSVQTAYLYGSDGCKSFNLTVKASPATPIPVPLFTAVPSSGGFDFRLEFDLDSDENMLLKNMKTAKWELFIYNAATNILQYRTIVSGHTTSVNTTGWKTGLYVAKAFINGYETSCKIIVK